MRYFAYGSNLSTKRIQKRCPSATFESRVVLSGYVLAFNKKGIDGSSKANIVYTGKHSDKVYGVTFDIAQNDVYKLDAAEGRGSHYVRKRIKVRAIDSNKRLSCAVYIAVRLTEKTTAPWTWYMSHIINGAVEHNLPADYITALRSVKAKIYVAPKPAKTKLPFKPGVYHAGNTNYHNAYAQRALNSTKSKSKRKGTYKPKPKQTRIRKAKPGFAISRDSEVYNRLMHTGKSSKEPGDVQVFKLDKDQSYLYDNGYANDIIAEALQLAGCADYNSNYDEYVDSIEIWHADGNIVGIFYKDKQVTLF